jgi:coenzyme F420 hydrogenase subunit beta
MFLEVINNDICIGCGVCSLYKSDKIKINFDKHGKYKASIIENLNELELEELNKICPFSSLSFNESQIANQKFNQLENFHSKIGYYTSLYSGYHKNEAQRIESSSGGLTSWLLLELYKKKLIDGVIHVGNQNNNNKLFSYKISYTENEILENTKTRYYPIELSQILLEINTTKKYAIVGIPCFIKAVRLLAERNKDINNAISFYIGIVCGHLKSKHFTSAIALQNEIDPQLVVNIDFRSKIKDKKANFYGAKIDFSKKNKKASKNTKPLKYYLGSDWGYGFYKYKACDYCDDVLNETADIVFGDAWIEPYMSDWKGHNIFLIRNKTLESLFKEGVKYDKIKIETVSEEEIIKSQASSFRHRNEGLAYRLYIDRKNKRWYPKKRVAISNAISGRRKLIYRLRSKISRKSHNAILKSIEKNNIDHLYNEMKYLLILYRIANQGYRFFIPNFIRNFIRRKFTK